MNAGELLSIFRSEMADTVEPYLWSDEEFYVYLNDAQVMFCRKTDGIADATTAEITQLPIVAGTEWYDVHTKIKKLRIAVHADNGQPVEIMNPETAQSKGVRFRGTTGRVQVIVWGLEEGKVRVWPTPVEDEVIELAVFRLPLTAITDEDSTFELPEQHHLALLNWVKARAYLKQDAETIDKTRANDFERRFAAYCDESTGEQSRARRSTGATSYGGC